MYVCRYMPEQSASTIDEEGYLHSGDVAAFDDNDHPDVPKPSGFMKITGRSLPCLSLSLTALT